MSEIAVVRAVEAMDGARIRVAFSDGTVREIDLGELLDAGGVFAPIARARAVFEQVGVNTQTDTVEWPGGVDLDPDVLYGRFEPASGVRLPARTVNPGSR